MDDKRTIPPVDDHGWLGGVESERGHESRLITARELIAHENGADYPCGPGEVSQGVLAALRVSGLDGPEQGGTISAEDFLKEMERETDAILDELRRNGHT